MMILAMARATATMAGVTLCNARAEAAGPVGVALERRATAVVVG